MRTTAAVRQRTDTENYSLLAQSARRMAGMKQSRYKTLSGAKHHQKENHPALLPLATHYSSTVWVFLGGAYLRRREKYGLKITQKVDLRLRSHKRLIYASNQERRVVGEKKKNDW